jgi:hypothetical protein
MKVGKGRTPKAPIHQLMEQIVCFRKQIRNFSLKKKIIFTGSGKFFGLVQYKAI